MSHNQARGTRCQSAINAYSADDARTNLVDFLADARHWCETQGHCFGDLDRIAYEHYIAERNTKTHSQTRKVQSESDGHEPESRYRNPLPFDGYEIHGVREFGRGRKRFCERVPDQEARFWSLFGHIPGRGAECIGDFKTRELAEEIYARITGRPYQATNHKED